MVSKAEPRRRRLGSRRRRRGGQCAGSKFETEKVPPRGPAHAHFAARAAASCCTLPLILHRGRNTYASRQQRNHTSGRFIAFKLTTTTPKPTWLRRRLQGTQ